MVTKIWIGVDTQSQSFYSDEKTHGAINNKMFKRLGYINDQLYELYEVALVKSEIEHKQLIIVGFFILECAKLRTLELYYIFLDKYFDFRKFEELELLTDLFYLALSQHVLYDCIRPAMKKDWTFLRSGDCTDEFSANSATNFFCRFRCAEHKEQDRRNSGPFKEEFRFTEMICLCCRTFCF